ncbi:MAG: flippase-like domain-containing protein [Deltaproteobacteria bacterium]|nr:flippase-like domain-containing protein [Deltaproteobacteria bacterium]
MWVRRLLPWVLSLGVVAFLFLTTDLAAVSDALASADWPRLVGFMALVTAATFMVDAATLVPLMRRFVTPVPYREVVAIKGVSYFLNALNYSLAAGGMAWMVHKKRQVPFLGALSALVWLFFVDIVALGVMLALGWAVGHELPGAGALAGQVPIVIAVVWAVILGALVYWNGRVDFLFFGFFRRWRLFSAFAEARLADYIPFSAIRVGFITLYVIMHWLLLPAFGVHIPFWALLMYAPLITFVQVIPANVSGLGAVQGVMVALFAPHVDPAVGDPRAVIIAYSTVIGPLMTAMRLVIGYAFMSTMARDALPTEAVVEAQRLSEEEGSTSAVGTSDT